MKKKQVDIYVASDGREFSGNTAEKECIQWEEILEEQRKWDDIKKVRVDSDMELPQEWFFPKDEYELEKVKKHIGFYDSYNEVIVNGESKSKHNTLIVGKWMGVYAIDGGDYKGVNVIYTLDWLRKNMNEYFSKIEST